jgi:hypothetical protein
MFHRLWDDTHGAVISPEIVIVGAILVIGVVAGLAALHSSLLTEIVDVTEAVDNIEFTPTITEVEDDDDDSDDTMPLTASEVFR